MNPRPTLQDIAREVGVTKATVSLALRDHPKISDATREKVKAAARKLNYRPDPALARIAAHRWRTREHPSDLVLAFVSTPHPWSSSESLPELRQGATSQGEKLGYRVEHFRLQDHSGAEQLARVLYHRGIRGVIVGQIFSEEFIRTFPWDQFACVGCHVGYWQPPVNVVLPDFHHAMVRLWREAVDAGYHRIGVALLREMEAVDLFDKVSAALYCQNCLTPELAPIPLRHFSLDEKPEFAAWVNEYKPDVVIGFNNTVGNWLSQYGYNIPDQIAFVSLDDPASSVVGDRLLTSMNPDYFLIGSTAVEQLDLLLRANRHGIPEHPLTVHVPSEWFAGDTLPPAGKSKNRIQKRAPANPAR